MDSEFFWKISVKPCILLMLAKNLHFVFLELCARPEFVDLIRDEIESKTTLDFESITQLPILDSFIKEAVRVNPLDKSEQHRRMAPKLGHNPL